MSRRISIATAIAEKLKEINGESPYTVNLNDNVFPKLKFWDEVSDFPCVYVVAGSEQREYHPGGFTWAFLNISLNRYRHSLSPLQPVFLLPDRLAKAISVPI